jgi:hypothetical protein
LIVGVLAGLAVLGAGAFGVWRMQATDPTPQSPRPLTVPQEPVVLYSVGDRPIKKRCAEQEAERDMARAHLELAQEALDEAETVAGSFRSEERDREVRFTEGRCSPDISPERGLKYWTEEVTEGRARLAAAQQALDECMAGDSAPGAEEGLFNPVHPGE